MASPQQKSPPFRSGGLRSPSPRAFEPPSPANGGSPLGDEAIWKRLREAGFDEESIKRRDKAALIAYISKLECEVYDCQHHMGLLILERKELTSKFEQAKESAESAKVVNKRDQAAHLAALAEARKREKNLEKALGIEKECVANIEKALHEMRAESAEIKFASESKMAEVRMMEENAQKKFDEAESKMRAAESLHADASRYHNTAIRQLQEVEAREGELRRRLTSFKSECDAKEKDINLERQALFDSQKILHKEQRRLLEAQTLLSRREEYIFGKSEELSSLEKELEKAKTNLDKELRSLKEAKSNLDLDMAALTTREEAVIKRESVLDKKERELLILQEKITSKEYDEIQRLKAEHQFALEREKSEFEAELEQKRMSLEKEMKTRKLACEIREADLNHREKAIHERENTFELQVSTLSGQQEGIAQKLKQLEEKEQILSSTEKALEVEMRDIQKEKEEIKKMKLDLEKIKGSVEDEKKQVLNAQEKLVLTLSERNELLILEMRLKEEIDSFRAQKMELVAEADKLKAEKEEFEIEWELIDEKREELRKEAEGIAEEKKAVSKYLKIEQDNLKLEKDDMRNQFKNDVDSLTREREEFIKKMEHDHSDWFNKIQREREDFVRDITIQRKEIENRINMRREVIETYLRDREESFEREKAKELQQINSQKEMIAKELEHVASELKRLDNERVEIVVDREQREREWSEINNSIEMLNIQRERLQKQRELLHADREEINAQIQHLKKLEDSNIASENRALSDMQPHHVSSSNFPISIKKCSSGRHTVAESIDEDPSEQNMTADDSFRSRLLPVKISGSASPPISATLSWVRKCAEVIFKRSPEKEFDANHEKNVDGTITNKPRVVSVGSEFEPANSNLQENKNSGEDRGVMSSKLEMSQDTFGIISEGMRSKGRESIGKFRVAQAASSGLDKSDVMLELPSLAEHVENPRTLEHKNNTNEALTRLNESSLADISGERSGTTDSSGNRFLSGRKRLNDSLSHDHANIQLEPSQEQHKKRRENEIAAVEESTSKCILLYPDDQCGPLSFNHTSFHKEVSEGFVDREHEIYEVLNKIKDTETFPNDTELSQNKQSALHCDILQNGGSHGLGNSSHVGNGVLSSSLYCHGVLKTDEQILGEVLLGAEEELSKENAVRPTPLVADNGDKLKDQDGSNRVNNDEGEEEDEERMSLKEKLWNFLIT